MVRIEKLKKPDLQTVEMNCDNVISKRLLKYPMVQEAFSTTSFNIICGRMGSGKTSLLTSLVKTVFRKCFHSIYLFMPANSRASIENDIYGKNLPENQIYDTLTLEDLTNVYEEIQENSTNGYFSLIIIDDFQVALKSPEILKVLSKIVTKMRHLRTSIFLLQQNFQALAKPLRELASNLIIFNLGKSQLEKVFEELIQLHKDKYQDIIDISFKDPHDWLLINLNKSRSIYKGFDRLIFDD